MSSTNGTDNPEERFDIGYDNDPPRYMIVQIPIGKWADDKEHGLALLYGHLREVQAHGAAMINQLRKRKASFDVIRPA